MSRRVVYKPNLKQKNFNNENNKIIYKPSLKPKNKLKKRRSTNL